MERHWVILLLGFFILFLGCVDVFKVPEKDEVTVYEEIAEKVSPPPECEAPIEEEVEEEPVVVAEPEEEVQPTGEVNFRYRGCGTEDTVDSFQGYRFTRIQLTSLGYYAIFCKDAGCEDELRVSEGDTIVVNDYCLTLNKLVKGYVLCNDYLQTTIKKC